MKRCPECYRTYDDEEKFCEADGRDLLADPVFSPRSEVVATAPTAKPVWWPAAIIGVVVGVVFGAGIFAAAMLFSDSERREPAQTTPATELRERPAPLHATVASSVTAPTPVASPSPEAEEQAKAEPSLPATTDIKTASAKLNEGPISTGQKAKPSEGDGAGQTVIEMTDGSTLNVDAAWQDKQGIWYRRGGLVSFVDSSRVKAITTRKETKAPDDSHR